MKKYHHLTQRERYLIEYHLSIGEKRKDIAYLLGVHASTVSREIKRNWYSYCNANEYNYLVADYKARKREDSKAKRTAFTKEIKQYVISKLKLQHSPEQIKGKMRLDIGQTISIETIYKFIYDDKKNNGNLYTHLRWQNKKRKKRFQKRNRVRTFGGLLRKSIHDRDPIIETKERFGDLEIDTIIGKNHKQAILTITDRKTKYLWMQKLIF